MIQYIYFVKCPNCEDEHFDFFDEAKDFALSCLSQKPVITQTEVDRNDFGECTDSHDLGTVWSWEDMMKETEAEPTISVFTKDDLKRMADGQDPEFDSIDNSVDFEVEEPEISEVSDDCRKPIPEGMTIEQLVEEMEENEDTVECTWCEELFDKSECRKEVDLGWLCGRCEAAIKSRGETLTFRENNYWDFLDEDFGDTRTLEDLVKDSIRHLTNDLGKDPWADDFADDVIKDIENNYRVIPPRDMAGYIDWTSCIASEVSRQLNNPNNLTEANLSDIAAAANSEFSSDWNSEDLLDMAGVEDDFRHTDIHTGMTPSERAKYDLEQERERAYKNKLAAWNRYKKSKTEDLDDNMIHDLGNEYDGSYPTEKPELPEIDEVSDSHLSLCPECGKETFDTETGICVGCGFN